MIGRDERLDHIIADILPENLEMQRVCDHLGFQLTQAVGDGVVRAVYTI